MLNLASLGSDAGIDHKTAQHWISLLETTYIAWRMPSYHRNFNKRLVKSPKLYFYDTGLLCHLLEIGSATDIRSHYARGAIFENFCLNELRKDNENTGVSLPFYFWRDSGGHEIDCLIEHSGVLHCIEIKSSSTINESFFTTLEYFRKTAHKQKVASYVIYGGGEEQRRSNADVVPWRKIMDISNTAFSV
jgi:predicted AAA+ superfamily ATPase